MLSINKALLSQFNTSEWRNYCDKNSDLLSRVIMLRQSMLAFIDRVSTIIFGSVSWPNYLPRVSMPINQKEPLMVSEDRSGGLLKPTIFSKEISLWAIENQKCYENYLNGKWEHTQDLEFYWTMHQFNWLLVLVFSESEVNRVRDADIRRYLFKWIEKLGNAKRDPAWRSYSISERLCNWIYLCKLLKPDHFRSQVQLSMNRQAVHLARHLECFKDGSTNNHLINNGRALYLSGCFLANNEIKAIGRKILIEEAARQFTKEGFLNEGSSHYQMIFTKNYIEALHAAKWDNDTEFVKLLESPVLGMLRACSFFKEEHAWEHDVIPFIGDISPDPPPQLFSSQTYFWQFADRAFCGHQDLDWSTPWFLKRSENRRHLQIERGWDCKPQSGYYRWNGKKCVIWWHARGKNMRRFHAHNDWGSFQLHVNGEPVFIDCGRESYSASSAFYDGRLTLSHNTVQVDGFEQAVVLKRALFKPDYLDDGAEIEYGSDSREAYIFMRIRGYQRLKNQVFHVRKFFLNEYGMRIEDSFEGEGIHSFTAAFHLDPNVQWDEKNGIFFFKTPSNDSVSLAPAPGGHIDKKYGGATGSPGGFCFREYGKSEKCLSVFAHYEMKFPARIVHKIDW